jgi:hypothetical protein
MRFVQKQRQRSRHSAEHYEQAWPLPRLETAADTSVDYIDESLREPEAD